MCYNINVSYGGQDNLQISKFTKEELAMTTYETLGYETSEALRNAINSDLAALAYPFAVKHRAYGEGQLTFVKAPLIGGSLYATIDFTAAGTKTIALDIVLANNLLEMPEILLDTLLELQTTFKADFIERETAHSQAVRQEYRQKREAAKQAAEAKKAEDKYEATKAKALKDFEVRSQAVSVPNAADEFYYSLGWLAKHAGTVTAALPDYLESAFIQRFGTEAPRRVMDSKKRYPSGWTAQWTWSFTISFKKPKQVGAIPAFLTDKLNPAGKMVSDTSFVWDLVDNYGFQFGKKQDVENIRSYVPVDCLASFEAGLLA